MNCFQILHILTASKEHAHTVLAAAQNSGFRESGATSLHRSNEPQLQSVMVAVRTSGLLLDSVIGYCQDKAEGNGTNDASPEINSLVDEAYLRMLVRLSNDRFVENEERINRFKKALRRDNEDGIVEQSNGDEGRNRKDKKNMRIKEEMKNQEEVRKERLYKSHFKDEYNDTDGFGWIFK